MAYTSYKGGYFPSQVVSDFEKITEEYGLKVAQAIEMYIQNYVGLKQDNTYGDIYFNKTLNDWAKFDINKRTKFDATISSGLAIMACNRHLYAPNAKVKKEKVNINIKRYNNHGVSSKLIK